MKKILALLLVLTLVFSFAGCEAKTGEVNIYVLSGPTGIGAVNLRADAEAGLTENTYNFNMVDANDETAAAISKGEADIAAAATIMNNSFTIFFTFPPPYF